MNRLSELDAAFKKYTKAWGDGVHGFPYGTTPTDCGGAHVEFSDDGMITFATTDRGEKNILTASYDVDEIMYGVFRRISLAYGFQVAFEKRQAGGGERDDRRIAFPLALERIGEIRQDWRLRLEREIDEILERAPYSD